MIVALVLALAAETPVADAERDFAVQATNEGQWTAFRATAAPDAVMFVPQKVMAQTWLKGRANPAQSVNWVPALTATACDASIAVTTGPYRAPDGETGHFSTVWRQQPDGGWKWLLDQGGPAPSAALDTVTTRALKASCIDVEGARRKAPAGGDSEELPLLASGMSDDATLRWTVRGDEKGHRRLVAWLWDGGDFSEALRLDVP
jgi:ketosteroid isomerase-like protein